MSLFIDILIIISAIWAVYSGIMRGFVRSIMGFISIILAIVSAFVFTSTVAEVYNEKFIYSKVCAQVETSFDELVTAGGQKLALSKIFEDKPDALKTVAEQFGIELDEIESHYSEIRSDDDRSDIKKLAEIVAEPTSKAISNILAAASVFVGTLIILKLATWFLDLICRLPMLSTLNSLLGFVFGLASAALSAWSIANIAVGMINALGAIRPDIFNFSVINGSIIVKFFYDHSLILFK